jgi:hypothetical protein
MDENKTQINNDRIKSLRTYTSDMADAVRTDEASVIKIALAEKEKRERQGTYIEKEETNKSKIFLITGAVILIMGAFFIFYFLSQNKEGEVVVIKKDIETFISYDSKSIIDVTNVTDGRELSSTIEKDNEIDFGLIKAIFLNKKTDGVITELSSEDFISIIGTSMPESLIRSLSKNYLLGKYSEAVGLNEIKKINTFLILETKDYNQTYASMLEWEPNMLKDLFTLFNLETSDKSIFEKSWSDLIIDNKDARVLSNINNENILYYIFINKNYLIVTDNIKAIKEISDRLNIKNKSQYN